MNKYAVVIYFIILSFFLAAEIHAKGLRESSGYTNEDFNETSEYKDEEIKHEENTVKMITEDTAKKEEINEQTEYLEEIIPAKKPIFFFEEGVAISWLTKIIKQNGRSNFVFKDFLFGFYFRTAMDYFKFFKPVARLAAIYPMKATFNDIPQIPKSPINIGLDFTAGVKFDIFDFKYVRINAGPAFHLLYLSSDRWLYLHLGGAAFLGIEVPVAERWTILLDGFASFDSANVGKNKHMEPFDITYQYQLDLGVRYSKKFTNKTTIFSSGKKPKSENENEGLIIRR